MELNRRYLNGGALSIVNVINPECSEYLHRFIPIETAGSSDNNIPICVPNLYGPTDCSVDCVFDKILNKLIMFSVYHLSTILSTEQS